MNVCELLIIIIIIIIVNDNDVCMCRRASTSRHVHPRVVGGVWHSIQGRVLLCHSLSVLVFVSSLLLRLHFSLSLQLIYKAL